MRRAYSINDVGVKNCQEEATRHFFCAARFNVPHPLLRHGQRALCFVLSSMMYEEDVPCGSISHPLTILPLLRLQLRLFLVPLSVPQSWIIPAFSPSVDRMQQEVSWGEIEARWGDCYDKVVVLLRVRVVTTSPWMIA